MYAWRAVVLVLMPVCKGVSLRGREKPFVFWALTSKVGNKQSVRKEQFLWGFCGLMGELWPSEGMCVGKGGVGYARAGVRGDVEGSRREG
mmetsp:Transcript_34157/g.96807  ORF Transcript_34157/g.96807 Transcript_34157/m.96807 type:complete len:90 (+) Transcript_34157:4244-4513(+)